MSRRSTLARRLFGVPGGALAITRQAAPRYFLLAVVLQLIGAVALVVQLFATRQLLSHLLTHPGDTGGAAVPLTLLFVALLVVGVTTALRLPVQQQLAEHVQRYALRTVLHVADQTDLLEFEGPQFNNRIQRAMMNAGVSTTGMATGLVSLLASLSGTVAVGATLVVIQPLLLIGLVVAAIPTFLAGRSVSRSLYQFGVEQTERDRERLVLQLLLTSRDNAKEIRGLGLGSELLRRWDDSYQRRLRDLGLVSARRARRSVAAAAAASLITAGLTTFLVVQVGNGDLDLAGAGTAVVAFLLLASQLQGLVSGATALLQNALFIDEFRALSSRDVSAGGPFTGRASTPGGFAGVTATDLTFRYPQAERPAIQGISLRIAPGETVAVVGANGSGKSTLAKVLAGLFPATAGAVTLNGVDYRDADIDSVRDRIAVLFQDYVKYQMSARDNVSVGRIDVAEDLARTWAAIENGGAHELVSAMPHGVDSMLGPQFTSGTELSGGQWQRLATARTLFRDADFVILDEPTAALDPHAEAELFARTRELFRGKAVLLISHRFASVRHADRIYVLERGLVVETGTHAELVRKNGLYASMFETQRQGLLGDDSDRTSTEPKLRRYAAYPPRHSTRRADG